MVYMIAEMKKIKTNTDFLQREYTKSNNDIDTLYKQFGLVR